MSRTERYRKLLQKKIDELREGLSARRAEAVVARPDEPLDFGDWCQKSHDEWLFLNQNRMEIELLRDLEGALRRIDAGNYGICQGCEEPIAAKRLDAVPWAKYCIPCQEQAAEGGPAPAVDGE
ncbi:MAG: TraR/DksA family transcriptional regulator [Acidobacteriota bacterium]